MANSTTRDGSAVTDSGVTLFPLDEGGLVVPILPARLSTVVTFRATIAASGTITNTARLLGYSGVEASDTIVVPGGGGSTACTLKLTNSTGTEVNYQPGDGIYVTVTDPDSNTSITTAQTIVAQVQNSTTGDLEALLLTETGVNTGLFRNTAPLPSSTSAGLGQNDGTLNVQTGNTISASHVDPAFGDTCPDTALISSPSLIKQLYLDTDGGDNDTTGDLDRVDPVATADATTSETSVIAAPFTSTIVAGTTTTSNTTGTSHTFTHSANTGTNRLLLVTVGVGSTAQGGTAGTVSEVTFAGTAMTEVGTAFSGAGSRIYIFALKDNPGTSYVMPSSGSVAITSSASSRVQAGATTFTGVDQGTSYGVFAPNNNTGSSAVSVAVASAVGNLVVAVAAADEGSNNVTIATSTTGGQAELWNFSSSDFVSSAASTKPGAAGDVTSSFTLNRTEDWAAGAISLRPAPVAGGTATFTQTPAFAEAFGMPAGGILGVTNYVRVAGGSLPANPAITATVRNGGTSIATLTNPTATLLSGGLQTITADGAASTGSVTEGSSGTVISGLNVNHTTGSGNNRLMLAGLQIENDNDGTFTITSVRWVVGPSTQNLSLVTSATSAVEAQTQIWSLTAPVSGAGQLQIVVNSGTADGDVLVAGVMTFSGVDQSTPLGTANSAIGAGTSATVSVTSAAGQVVFDAVSADDSRGLTIVSGQTSRWNLSAGGTGDGVTGAASTKAGAATVSMSWTLGAFDDWAICAVPIRPALLPAIYQVDWSTPLAGAANLTAGQAISLTVGNAGASDFSVLYDSSTYPSKVNLPTNTVIHTDTVEVYDAPYPGGSLVTTPTAGQTLYVRVTAGDPFGAYDITSLPLVIDGPGVSGDVSTTLTNSSVVASTAASKTYEYVWATGSTEGNFTITATAKEGFENTISSSKSTVVNISSLDLGTPSTTEFTTGNNGPHTLQYAPNETIFVRVSDLDENTNSLVSETITVTIIGSGGDVETVTLTETGPNTGIFTGGVPASSTVPGTGGNGTLYALQGSVPVVNYVDNDDPTDTGNDTAIIPAGSPGVSVTKTLLSPADGQILVGETAQYRLRVTNTGNSILNTVQVIDSFNATQLSFMSASPAPNSSTADSRTWTNVGPLASGQSVDIIVDFNGLAAANPSINTVNVTTGPGGPTASDTEPVIITRPAVTVIKTLVSPNPGPANKGDDVVFNISVQNTGTTALATVPLEDTFSDADFEFVSATVAPDGIGAGSLLWNDISGAGDLAVNATFNVSVTLKAKGAANPATNLAAVSYAVDTFGDPVPPSSSSAGLQTLAATISGTVFEDRGVAGFGGDIPLPNVTVKLYSDPNGDGDPSDGSVLAVTTSDPTGYYEFLNLGVARYVVVEEDLLGYSSVADTAGANDNRIPVNVVTLTSYPNNNFLDRLVDPATYGSISGQVRNDTNANGNLADSESGLAGAVVTLFTDPNGDGNPSDGIAFGVPVTTTASGTYSFTNLPPGTYVVVETDPAGFVSTADVVNPNNNQIPVNLAPSAAVTGRDFLDTSNTAALGVIGNQVWIDTNNDGLFGGGESGVNGVVVQLYLSSQTPGVDSPYLTTTTSGGGLYQFANVPAGNYVVYLPASNFGGGGALADAPLSSTITVGIDNTTNNDDNGIQTSTGASVISPVIALAAGETDNSKDFGFVPTTSLGSITGTVRVDTDGNGTGDTLRGGATLSLLDGNGSPILGPGNVPVTTVTASDGTYSFGDLPPGTYRVAKTPDSGYRSLSDKDGGNPDLILAIVVLPGQENPLNDFLEMLQKCPDLWTEWQDKWDTILGGDTAFTENPDGDRYSNLLEYAFCMPPHSGGRKPFCLTASLSVAGAVDGVFSRTAGSPQDVTYILDYAADLGDPTSWSSLTLNSGNTTVTNNGDGSETVRIVDLESRTGLTAGKGFVRIRVQLDNGVDTAGDATEVLGWVETQLGLCCRTYNNPFLACATFTGTVDSVNGQELVLTTSAGPINIANLLVPGVAYYIEVETGHLEGHRFDVTSATATSLVIANDASLSSATAPFNTLTGAAPALLAGDRIALHTQKTLNGLFPPTSFGAGADQTLSDEVQVYAGGAWKIYWLQANGGSPRWVDADDLVPSDKGTTVIPPGQGVFFHNRTAPAPLLAYGEVRGHDFRRPLLQGVNLVGGGYPVDQSATGANSRQLNLTDGFFGSRNFKTADSFFVWRTDGNAASTGYDTYFLLDGGATQPTVKRWVITGDVNIVPRDAELLFKRDAGVMTRVATDKTGYLIPTPWAP